MAVGQGYLDGSVHGLDFLGREFLCGLLLLGAFGEKLDGALLLGEEAFVGGQPRSTVLLQLP